MNTNASTNKRYKIMKSSKGLAKAKQQQGAVMITVLMILVVITLMGVSSMKQGMFQARLGSAVVTQATCFMAAESGLNALYRDFQDQSKTVPIGDVNNFMNQASATHVKHCMGNAGLITRTGTTCSQGLSEYSDIQVALLSRPSDSDNPAERDNYATFKDDIDRGGVMLIYTESRCEVPGVDMAVTNTQAWQHRSSNSLPKHSNTNI